jgi:hypothetical protein
LEYTESEREACKASVRMSVGLITCEQKRKDLPQTRISRTKAENRKSHAAIPPSTGGSENSGSVARISSRSRLLARSSISDSLTAPDRGGELSIESAYGAVIIVQSVTD